MDSCDCSNTSGDFPEVYDEKEITARKPHRCCECGGEIRPGDNYHYVKGLWGGHWETYRTCSICARIRQDLCPCGWIFGELSLTVSECLGVEL